jgi:hypothetical protein
LSPPFQIALALRSIRVSPDYEFRDACIVDDLESAVRSGIAKTADAPRSGHLAGNGSCNRSRESLGP